MYSLRSLLTQPGMRHPRPALLAYALMVAVACSGCLNPAPSVDIATSQHAVEVCTDGSDDDLDGFIDCIDPDCADEPQCDDIFPCEAVFYQVASGQVFAINTATTPFSLTPIGGMLAAQHNAMGYNIRDGYLYMLNADDRLIRVDRNGTETNLGQVTGLGSSGTSSYFVGDFDLNGNLWVQRGNTFSVIDVAARTATVHTSNAPGWDPADMAYNPDDNKFYGVDENILYTFDPAVSQVTTRVITGELPLGGGYGAAFMGSDGTLYVIENATGAVRSINLATAVADTIGTATLTSANDGAACALAPIPFEICANNQDDDDDNDVDEPDCVVVADGDGDGIADSDDIDDDNDGIPDVLDGPGDTDGDGVPDRLDLDSDNDGVHDVIEAGHDGADTNGDGMVDGPDVGNNGLPNSVETTPDSGALDYDSDGDGGDRPADSDGDGVPDFQDLDSDNDGIADVIEAGYDPDVVDTNNDGVVDDGTDADRDGIQDSVDGSPNYGDADTGVTDRDTDGDGSPDRLDIDSDGDGASDLEETGNGGLDENDDGRIDDTNDPDGDGAMDPIDRADGTFGDIGTDPGSFDEDGDMVPDPYDSSNGPGPNDQDGDGVEDGEDNCPSMSNPDQADGDNDGVGTACDDDEGDGPGADAGPGGGLDVAGGGCSASAGGAEGGAFVLLMLALIALLWRRDSTRAPVRIRRSGTRRKNAR